MTSDPAHADLTRDRVLRIETPEHVSVEFPLAGPGSRFGALLLDAFLMALTALALLLGLALARKLDLVSPQFALGLTLFALAALFWGYFFVFELLRDGQTPGKRAFGIRVVLDGGHPLTAQAAAVRNLLRVVDLQPGVTCLLGGLSILVDGRGRRLGDLAAGTVVVRDLPIEFPEPVEVGLSSAPPELSDAAFRTLENFVERAPELPLDARRRLAGRLTRALGHRTDPLVDPDRLYPRLRELHAEERRRRAAARLSTAAGTPAAAALLRLERGRWESLRESVDRLRALRLWRASEEEVSDFAARYRALSADLARARTYGASARTLFALEHLVASAHNLFYRPTGRGAARLWAFLTGGFPRLVRELRLPLLIAAATFLVPAVIGYALVLGDPELERLLVNGSMIERAEKAVANPTSDYRDTWEGAWMGSDALATALISNNVQVALKAFVGGFVVGLGALVILAFNGLHLGTALAVFANRGVLDNVGLFVLPHGPIELTAIVISGGAGLWMGSAVWFPGRAPRGIALVTRARQAAALLVGVIAMLVLAGLIEGFLSPSRLPGSVKVGISLATIAWLVAYLGAAGRGRSADGDSERGRSGDRGGAAAARLTDARGA
jgi:uncharacterized membrane protein SpoIIM required for sporulation/uncharacterized RDD family membrane protein YckC